MKTKALRNAPLIILLFITGVFAKLQANKHAGSETDFCMNICSDARGYYAWLPAVFIYHDLNFGFFEKVEVTTVCGGTVGGCLQDYRYSFDGRNCNKYYPGASFMMLPFFAAAHLATCLFTDYPANGYSPLYFKIMGWSGIIYYFLGMIFFLSILRKLKLNVLQQSLTVVLVSFGSNIIYYSVDKPVYSHIYSFALIAAFIYYSLCFRERFASKYLALIAFIAGWIFITRPVNIAVVILVPFLFMENRKQLFEYFSGHLYRLTYFLPALLMPLLLFSLYKLSTGSFFIYSYKSEVFDFLHPHISGFLAGYDNGIFPYTPLLLMPFLLIFAWYKKEYRYLIGGVSLVIVMAIYVNSAWWCWWYGFSFGARPMLDFLPLSGILIGLSLKQDKVRRYAYILPVYLLCCMWTMMLYHLKSHGGFMQQYPVTDYWDSIRHILG